MMNINGAKGAGKMKKTVTVMLAAMLLTSCNEAPAELERETAAVTSQTSAEAEDTEAAKETTRTNPKKRAETKEETEAVSEEADGGEDITEPPEGGLTAETYMSALLKDKQFRSVIKEYCVDGTAYCQVIDLNDDGIPEVILNYVPYGAIMEQHQSVMFSRNDEGVFKVIDKERDDATCTYEGSLLKPYFDAEGKPVFIADMLRGGSGTAEFGKLTVSFDGRNASTGWLMLCSRTEGGGVIYRYMDGEQTYDSENDEYTAYMESLSERDIFSGEVMLEGGEDNCCAAVKTLLEDFFKQTE